MLTLLGPEFFLSHVHKENPPYTIIKTSTNQSYICTYSALRKCREKMSFEGHRNEFAPNVKPNLPKFDTKCKIGKNKPYAKYNFFTTIGLE